MSRIFRTLPGERPAPWGRTGVFCVAALALVQALPLAAGEGTSPERPALPAPRFWARAAYDAESDRIIMFGGGNVTGLNDTWAYDMGNNSWQQMHPARGPSARMGHAMAYDAQSDRMILFGGVALNPPCAAQFYTPMLDDTWAYDFNNDSWEELHPASFPRARDLPGMAYDSQSDRMVLFGGQEQQLALKDDTWAFDYENRSWERLHPTTRPSAHAPDAMAYDPRSDRVVIFGGFSPWAAQFSETWAFDLEADNWTQIAQENPPSDRTFSHMAYDAAAQRLILFGGETALIWDSGARDLWALDNIGANWTKLSDSGGPASSVAAAFAYNSLLGRSFYFGGAIVTKSDLGCYAAEERTVANEQWALFGGNATWVSLNRPLPPDPLVLQLVSADPASQRATVSLEWAQVPPPAGAELRGANIYRSSGAADLFRLMEGANGTTALDDQATCGKWYTYAVAMESSAGEGPPTQNQTIWVPECLRQGPIALPGEQLAFVIAVAVGGGLLLAIYLRRARSRPD